jgi:hypothetical protein
MAKQENDPDTAAYDIHDNGGCPFRVRVRGPWLDIFRDPLDYEAPPEEDDTSDYEAPPVEQRRAPDHSVLYKQLFIGKSPATRMTRYSGGHGPEFDGNTILYSVPGSDREYAHIGRDLAKFRTHASVVEFVSPVGNNDVPYPYAVDALHNTYLIIEGATLTRPWRSAKYDDPYSYYYWANLITPDIRYGSAPIPPPVPGFRGVAAWWLGEAQCTMTHTPRPEENYDRLTMDPEDPGEMRVQLAGEPGPTPLTREGYAKLMRDFGAHQGFEPLLLEGGDP